MASSERHRANQARYTGETHTEVLVDASFGSTQLLDGASPVHVARLARLVLLREPDEVNRRAKRAQETTGIVLVLRRDSALVRVDVHDVDFIGRCDARDEDDGPRFFLVGTQLILGGRITIRRRAAFWEPCAPSGCMGL